MQDIINWLNNFNLDNFFQMLTDIGDFILNAITEFIEGIDYIISTLIGSYIMVSEYSVSFGGIVDNMISQLPSIYLSVVIVFILMIAFFVYLKKVL